MFKHVSPSYIVHVSDLLGSSRNILMLAQSYTVYAIDLLGFGASDKPEGFSYTMEVWAQVYF